MRRFHRYYQRLVAQREAQGGEPGGAEPEYRLPHAIVGAPLVTIGLFWFGWTTYVIMTTSSGDTGHAEPSWRRYPSIHWIVPIIGSAVFGTGFVMHAQLGGRRVSLTYTLNRILLVFSGVFTFLVDAYPLYAASALAANSFARSSFAAAFPLFGIQSRPACAMAPWSV